MRKLLVLCFALVLCCTAFLSTSYADEWGEEFARLCGHTADAQEMDMQQLAMLISDCDGLIERINTEGDKTHKVYLFRLKKCRNFYKYTLDLKTSKGETLTVSE